MSKRALQIVVAVLGLVPLAAGTSGVLFGPERFAGPLQPAADLDSHFRYLSGIFLALGVTFYTCIPGIERKTARFRWAAALVVAGGLARLYSLLTVGAPTLPHLAGLALELVVVPLLVLWQARLSRGPQTACSSPSPS